MIQTFQNIVKLLTKKDKKVNEYLKQEKIDKISTKFTQFYQKFQEKMEKSNFKQATPQSVRDILENTNNYPTPINDRSIKSKGLRSDMTTDNFIYSPSTGECNSFYDNLIESYGFKDRIRDETTILKDSTYHPTRSLKSKNFP